MINMKKSSDNAGKTRSSLHDKTLYICSQLTEYGHGRSASTSSLHIHALNLNHLMLPFPANSSTSSSVINSSNNSNTNMLRAVTTRILDVDHDLPNYLPASCGVFGSRILFVGRRFDQSFSSSQVYEFETTTDPSRVDPKQQLLEIKKACFPSFFNGKERALLIELDDGKLYAVRFSHCEPDPPLMAFDPRKGVWSALPYPPLALVEDWWDVCCATVGTDILVWSTLDDDPKVLYCFDTVARRWTRRSTVDPLISSGGRALVLNCEDVGGGLNGLIMFTYSCTDDWDSIQVYHMSKEYEHLRHIESHQMPHHDQFPPAREGWDEDSYSFVHLGGRQVCLVLGSQIWHRGEGNRLTIVVVLFEYAMADQKKKKSPISEFNFLTTRLFKFDHLNPHPTQADVLGAFVVPPPQPVPVVLPNT